MAWTLIESDGDWTENMHTASYMVDNETDIASPPKENEMLRAGSIAYTANLKNIWQKNANGTWVKVGE